MSILPSVSEHIESHSTLAVFVLTATVTSSDPIKAQAEVVRSLQEVLCDDIGANIFFRISPKDWRLLNASWVQSPDEEKLAVPQLIKQENENALFAVDVVFEVSSEDTELPLFKEMQCVDDEVSLFNQKSNNVKLQTKRYPDTIETELYARCQSNEVATSAAFKIDTDVIFDMIHGIKTLLDKKFERAIIKPFLDNIKGFPAGLTFDGTERLGSVYGNIKIRLFDSAHFQLVVEDKESVTYLSEIMGLNDLLGAFPEENNTTKPWIYRAVNAPQKKG